MSLSPGAENQLVEETRHRITELLPPVLLRATVSVENGGSWSGQTSFALKDGNKIHQIDVVVIIKRSLVHDYSQQNAESQARGPENLAAQANVKQGDYQAHRAAARNAYGQKAARSSTNELTIPTAPAEWAGATPEVPSHAIPRTVESTAVADELPEPGTPAT